MESKITGNRLPPRLVRESEFRRIIRNGRRFRFSFLKVYIHPAGKLKGRGSVKPDGRVGFVVPDRAVKGSVGRNRVKRLFREAVRHWWKYILPGYDIVLKAGGSPEYDHARFVEAVFLKVIMKAGILNDEGRAKAEEKLAAVPEEYSAVIREGERR